MPSTIHPWRNPLRLFLQIFIGGILFASSVGKALDLPGFIEVLRTYQVFSGSLLGIIAAEVTAFEFLVRTWMLSGWRLRNSAAGLKAGYSRRCVISYSPCRR